MKRILCYGDSNTWGHDPTKYDPDSFEIARYAQDVRWTGVMQRELGAEYTVCEEGLCGRTTVFDDPTRYGWNGNQYFEVALRTCDPVDCIIFMLGTNDAKDCFSASSLIITMGMERLLRNCMNVLRDSYSPNAKIILASPLKVVRAGDGTFWFDFSEKSTQKLEELRSTYRTLAERFGCAYFDVNEIAKAHPADGVHMDVESHGRVGIRMAKLVREVLK